jgi:hypothetical protein
LDGYWDCNAIITVLLNAPQLLVVPRPPSPALLHGLREASAKYCIIDGQSYETAYREGWDERVAEFAVEHPRCYRCGVPVKATDEAEEEPTCDGCQSSGVPAL